MRANGLTIGPPAKAGSQKDPHHWESELVVLIYLLSEVAGAKKEDFGKDLFGNDHIQAMGGNDHK